MLLMNYHVLWLGSSPVWLQKTTLLFQHCLSCPTTVVASNNNRFSTRLPKSAASLFCKPPWWQSWPPSWPCVGLPCPPSCCCCPSWTCLDQCPICCCCCCFVFAIARLVCVVLPFGLEQILVHVCVHCCCQLQPHLLIGGGLLCPAPLPRPLSLLPSMFLLLMVILTNFIVFIFLS